MSKLYWNTASGLLREVLEEVMASEVFDKFRLVGGTALALQLGHRISVDIDLFTDEPYGSVDFERSDQFLRAKYPYVSLPTHSHIGMGRQYFVGDNADNAIKLDIYYTDAFIRPPLISGVIRMATIEEITAMKVDVVQRAGRKKDFWDLHELMETYTIEHMLKLHEERYPYNHDRDLILRKFIEFETADEDFEPNCLKGKYWEVIKLDILETIKPLG